MSRYCISSFMTRSNTNCRTALVAPTAGDSIREAHSYEYDNNGNILYVNTLRVKPDMTAQPDTVQRTREEKFRWDEENRLTALSENGYVSNYWYAAAGEYSAYSYEDLPSDIIGAYFGASYFDPNSKLTLGEQIKAYLDSLGATIPQEAPNYKQLPKEELKTPSRTNHSTTPVYTQENP